MKTVASITKEKATSCVKLFQNTYLLSQGPKYFAKTIRKATCTKLLKQSNYYKHISFYTHFYNCSQVTGAEQACRIEAYSQILHQVPPSVL
jgi:hypothetical protein